jgi:molybdopterin converting factor subunit 1
MKVSVQFFASHRDITGCDEAQFDMPADRRVRGLADLLAEAYPRLAPLMGYSRPAVNEVYQPWDFLLQDGDVVAFIPPVSGGAPG